MSSQGDLPAQDFWSIVFRQLGKNRLGLAGLGVVFLLYLVAVFAPFLAESKPVKFVHSNSADAVCLICQDMGDAVRRITLNDGRVFETRSLKRTGDQLAFESGGRAHTVSFKAHAPRIENITRRHEARATYPLLRALGAVDLYLLLSLGLLVAAAPIFIVSRRHGRTRTAAFRRALLLAAPLAALGGVLIQTRTVEVHRLNQIDFRLLEQGLSPGDSMTWPLIRHAPTDIDKRVVALSKPWPHRPGEDELRRARAAGDEWEAGLRSHPLGADDQRRDVLSMMIHATRVSLSVGFFSVSIYVTIGILMGSTAGYYGGWVDALIMRIIEIIMCFPTLFLIITILAIVKPSIFWVMGTIAFVGWTTVARLIRAEFLKLRQQDFVQSARALGASRARIIFRHILPNAVSPVFVSATFGIAGAILIESALSFLGIGIPVDLPTWGNVLRAGRNYVETDWWLALWPGLAIFLTVTSINLFGEALRDAMDPRLKGTQ